MPGQGPGARATGAIDQTNKTDDTSNTTMAVSASTRDAPAATLPMTRGTRLASWGLLLVVCALVLTPLGALLYGAIRSHPPGSRRATFTFANIESVFGGLFTGGWTQSATLHSLALAIPVMFIACAIGVLLAWSITRTDLPGRRAFECLFLLPMLYSPLVGVIG